MIIKELQETVALMNSADYKDRFKAEYYQTAIRYKKLKQMVIDWDNGILNFTPTCPRSTFIMQAEAMGDYLAVLEARAKMEDIEIESTFD